MSFQDDRAEEIRWARYEARRDDDEIEPADEESYCDSCGCTPAEMPCGCVCAHVFVTRDPEDDE